MKQMKKHTSKKQNKTKQKNSEYLHAHLVTPACAQSLL